MVKHYSIIRKNEYGGLHTTTLCGRMDNKIEGGWNVASKKERVTCKHCLKAKETSWGKKLIKQNIK